VKSRHVAARWRELDEAPARRPALHFIVLGGGARPPSDMRSCSCRAASYIASHRTSARTRCTEAFA